MHTSPKQRSVSTDSTTTHFCDSDPDSVLSREEERRHAETLRDAR